MPHALDARPSALPRSLALSSFSYLTVVVAALLVRALLPASAPPPTREVPFVIPPHVVDVFTPAMPAPSTPPTPPAVREGPIVPVDPRQAVDPALVPRQDSVLPLPAVAGPGTRPAGPGPVGNGPAGGGADADHPALGEFVYTETSPVLVKTVLPEYPSIAQAAGMEGTVLLLLLVGRDGRVREAKVAHPGTPFDQAAIAAGEQFVFTPATASGHPVAVWVSQQVRFVLR